MEKNDSFYIKKTISLAKKGQGKTSPNPLVGAVIVNDGKIVGYGYHKKAGLPHAEIEALNRAGDNAKGATLYTNLEPCSHYGRTPPCSDAIIKAGIKRVVFSIADPNPIIEGREKLEKAGIEVNVGILEESARKLNEVYFKFITQKKPFVILKVGMSMDGKITGQERYITSEASLKMVHRLRSLVDAIMVGKGTIIADNPYLTTRLVKGKSPIKIVVTSDGNIPVNSNVFGKKEELIIASTKSPPKEIEEKAKIIITKEKQGLVDINDLLLKLGEMGITSILLEGGKRLIESFLKEKLLDKVIFFISPKLIGKNGLSLTDIFFEIERIKIRRVADDIMVSGYPKF